MQQFAAKRAQALEGYAQAAELYAQALPNLEENEEYFLSFLIDTTIYHLQQTVIWGNIYNGPIV